MSDLRLVAGSQPTSLSTFTDREIVIARGAKNPIDPRVPYAFFVEPEHSPRGTVDDVATLFLTNRECPFHCLYCDLWKNTTDERVPPGAIPAQIDHALARLPAARHIKLYNSGNFFDAQAIPPEDHRAIAERVSTFETVIVENHPLLCGASCVEFRDLLAASRTDGTPGPELEIALGLETVHPGILPRLNKRMTLEDFRRAAEFLRSQHIALRAFILLRPPGMVESECADWALKSIEFAFDCGVRVCAVIPTRGGNGIMEQLHAQGEFGSPRLRFLEETLDRGLALRQGRVFVDVWDIERFYECPSCGPARAARLREMNLTQRPLPAIACEACGRGRS